MLKWILASLFAVQSAFAGLPPTTVKGQSETTAPTIFNVQAPYNQATTNASVTRLIETGNENLLLNPNFEASTFSTSWTCATFSCIVSTSTVGSGKQSGTVTNANSVNTVIEQSVTPTINLASRNFQASMDVFTSVSGFQVCALVAGAEVACSSVPASSTFVPVIVNFVSVASSSVGVRLKSTTSASKQVFFDNAYVGPAKNLAQGAIISGWNSYNLVIGAVTTPPTLRATVTINYAQWRQVGSNMEIQYQLQTSGASGNNGSGVYKFPLPAGYTIDTTNLTPGSTTGTPIVGVGRFGAPAGGETDTPSEIVMYDSTNLAFNNTDAVTTGQLGSGQGLMTNNTTARITFIATVPILGWAGNGTTVNASQVSNIWSGYHDSTCSWARTNASYGDPTADSTCVFTQRQNVNFGTVTSALSGSDKLPGIVFTPSISGYFQVCATAYGAPNVTALGATIGVQLVDNSGTQAVESVESGLVTSNFQLFSNCAFLQGTAGSSYTTKLQTKASAGQITIGGNGGSAIEWTVVNVSAQFPQPLVIGSVVNGKTSTGVSVHFTTNFGGTAVTNNCNGTNCALFDASSSGWSLTRVSQGNFHLDVSGSQCTGNLKCVINAVDGTNGACVVPLQISGAATASTSTTYSFSIVNCSSLAGLDGRGTASCDCNQ